MSLRLVNLNQLPLLQALLNHGSVVEAARAAGLSQPAMSGALAQLRETFQDPLLVRSGRAMKLTGRAIELRAQVNAACDQISQVYQPKSFDPHIAARTFTVAAPDDLIFLLCRSLVEQLKNDAPGIRLRFVGVPMDLPRYLEARQVDLAVCANFDLWPNLHFEALFDDELIYAVSRDHPLANVRDVTHEHMSQYPSTTFNTDVLSKPTHGRAGVALPILQEPARLSTGSFTNAALIAAETRAIARMPQSFFNELQDSLSLQKLTPEGASNAFSTGMFWSDLQDASHANTWLREVVRHQLG